MGKTTTVITMVATATTLAWSNGAIASTFYFNNGCSRSCTGDWGTGSQPGNVVCHGTAGPLSCPTANVGSTNTQTARRAQDVPPPPLQGANFSVDGQVTPQGRTQR